MEKSLTQILLEKANCKTRAYSGRGMFGKYCLGVDVITDCSDFLPELFSALGDMSCSTGPNPISLPEGLYELATSFESMRSDSMGKGMIYYFPKIQFIEDEPSDLAELAISTQPV